MNDVMLPEEVRIVQLTEEKMKFFWEKLKGFDRLYSDTHNGDELGFYKRLMGKNIIVFEVDGGIIIVDNITENERAQVHVSFWDKHLSSRTGMLKEVMKWVMEIYGLNRLEAMIPEFSHALKRFLTERMGFVFEGRLRERLLFQGQFKDVLVFSILRKEVFENG